MSLPARTAGTLLAAAALLAALTLPAGAAAAPSPPADLRVPGGEGWRAQNGFALRWNNDPGGPTISSVHYLVRNPLAATVVGPIEVAGGLQAIDGIWVPDVGAAYTAEVWLEDSSGAEGPRADAKLRFDPSRPGNIEPIPASGWIGRTELPLGIRLTHPSEPPPVSGIRGYAVSIDQVAAASPCAAANLCSEAETDLRGGTADDALVVDELPEGTSYVHALAVSGSQMRSLQPGHALLRVDKTDPLTRLSGAPSGWSNRAVLVEATATDSLSGMAPAPGGAPFTAIRVDEESPIVALGDSVTATVVEAGIHTVSFYARDAAGNVDDGTDANGHANRPPASVPVRIDREPPAVVFAGSARPGDPELIEARVSDRLSGPEPARGEIAVRAAGSTDPYEPLPTAGSGETLLARWASDDYPVGEYEFRVTGYDAAGNTATGTLRANGEPMVLPNPLKARASLQTGFGGSFGRHATSLTVRHGSSTTFSGRLAISSDAPLEGRSLTVVERFDPGASEPRRTTVLTTDEQGRFALRLAPGASREVFAIFGGTSTATGTASRPLRLDVRGAVSLRVSARWARVGGRPIVFRGSVAFERGELPPAGAAVQLQFRAAGLPWSEFRTVQTDRRGRFRYSYRFSDDDSRGIRFLFRASVPAESGWPYEAGSSSPLTVRGT